jgi:SAM-dependent methyltransferase
LKLDIGGGKLVHADQENWYNLDPIHGSGQFKRYAQDLPWPIESHSLDHVTAFHVMEHILAGSDRINVMNEMHRVLKPNKLLEIRVPLMVPPFTHFALADPTHVSYWIPESFGYFDGTTLPNADYGIRRWNTISFEVNFQWEGHWCASPLKSVSELMAFKMRETHNV